MKLRNHHLYLFAVFFVMGFFIFSWEYVQAEEDVSTAYYSLTYQEPADVFLGKAGVFMVRSSYNAIATINRFDPDFTHPSVDLVFYDRWLDFGIYDYLGNPYTGLYGFNYAYFNLKYNTRRLWDEGKLSIYRWDINKRDWVKCPSYLVEMKSLPHGRVSCIMTTFGFYGIATEK